MMQFFFISTIRPMIAQRFLLHVSFAYGIPVCKPLENEILKRGSEVRWFAEETDSQTLLSEHPRLLRSAQAVMDYRPDFVLCASNTVPYFFPGIKVQLFHGFSVDKRSEKKGHFRLRGLFDLYCTRGPFSTLKFKALSRQKKYFSVMETGWSKLDPLFPVPKIKKTKPVVFLASTFTRELSLAHQPLVVEEIQRMILSGKWHWMINLHPKMDKEVVAKFKSLQGDYEYIDFITDIKILHQADVMLCDTSSIATEFILQRKPVVTFRNRKPGEHLLNVTEPSQMEKALDKALTLPTELITSIDDFIKVTHPYADGKSSQRVIDACLYFKEHQSELVMGSKPLNLVRKWQSRKRLGYFRL